MTKMVLKMINKKIIFLATISVIYLLILLFLQTLVLSAVVGLLLFFLLSVIVYSSLLLLFLYKNNVGKRKENFKWSILLAALVLIELFVINILSANIHSISDVISINAVIPIFVSSILPVILPFPLKKKKHEN